MFVAEDKYADIIRKADAKKASTESLKAKEKKDREDAMKASYDQASRWYDCIFSPELNAARESISQFGAKLLETTKLKDEPTSGIIRREIVFKRGTYESFPYEVRAGEGSCALLRKRGTAAPAAIEDLRFMLGTNEDRLACEEMITHIVSENAER